MSRVESLPAGDPRIAAAEFCERAIAGACVMYGATAVHTLNELGFDPGLMWTPVARLVVQHAVAQVAAGSEPSFPEYATELVRQMPLVNPSVLTDLCEHIGDGTRMVAWVQEVRQASRRREAAKQLHQSLDELEAGADLDQVCEATTAWIEGFRKPAGKKDDHITDLLRARLSDYAEPLDPLKQIKTGLTDLDEILALEGSDFLVLGGGTGSGKSMLGLNLVANILQTSGTKGAGLVVSLEMPAHQIVDRLIARFAGISTTTLKRRLFNKLDFPRIAAASKVMEGLDLHVRDDCHELHQITAAARAIHAERGLRVLMVDYLQLVKGPDRELREQQVAAVSRELRLLGLETGALVIGLIQLNKQGEARESSAIQMDATQFAVLRSVNTEGRAFRGDEEEELDETRRRLDIGKQRDGSVGSVLLGFDGARATFQDTDQPEKNLAKPTGNRRFRGSTSNQ